MCNASNEKDLVKEAEATGNKIGNNIAESTSKEVA